MLIDCPLCPGMVETTTGRCAGCRTSFTDDRVRQMVKRTVPASRLCRNREKESQPFSDRPDRIVIARVACDDCELNCHGGVCDDAALEVLLSITVEGKGFSMLPSMDFKVPEGHVLVVKVGEHSYPYLGPILFSRLEDWHEGEIVVASSCSICGSDEDVLICDGCGKPVCNREADEFDDDDDARRACRAHYGWICRLCEEAGIGMPNWDKILKNNKIE